MQPDPNVFLAAIRREISREDLFGSALASGLSPILMIRAAEGLAQLQLRHGQLPQLLRALHGRQRAALGEAQALLTAAKLVLPVAIASAAALPLPPGEAGEEDVRFYEHHVDALCASIAALSAVENLAQPFRTRLAALCATASSIEHDMRTQYVAALASFKRETVGLPGAASAPRAAPTAATLTSVLRTRFPDHPGIEAVDLRPLAGVNAQEIFFFECQGHPQWQGPMVLRRPSEYNPTQAQLADEFELLNDLHAAGLPVARVLTAERASVPLQGDYIVMERLTGKPQTAVELGERGRDALLQIAAILARIHALDARKLSAPYRDHGGGVRGAMQRLIDRFHRRWLAERVDGSMVLESAFSWLRANSGMLDDRVSLVHGDCNLRNVLIDGTRVSAVLDWELAHAGHAAEDLSYIRPDVEAVMPWQDFIDAYIGAGGRAVSPQALRYFEVWKDTWRTAMAACIYGAFVRGVHRNFIFGTVAFHEYYATLDTLAAFMARDTSKNSVSQE